MMTNQILYKHFTNTLQTLYKERIYIYIYAVYNRIDKILEKNFFEKVS